MNILLQEVEKNLQIKVAAINGSSTEELYHRKLHWPEAAHGLKRNK